VAGGHIFVSDAMVKAFMARNFNPNTGNVSGLEKPLGNGYEVYHPLARRLPPLSEA